MIILQAPVGRFDTTTFLPNPEFGDSYKFDLVINKKKSMNNTNYTYVRDSGNRLLSYSIRMDRAKSLELIAFLELYHASQIQMTNHLGEVWQGYITSDPPRLQSTGRVNRQEYQLEFEGVKIG